MGHAFPAMRVTTFSPAAFKKARAGAGLSQSALAREIGRTRTLIAHWEGGRRAPSWMELGEVAEVLGVSAEALYERAAPDPSGGLRELRRARSLTQREVASWIGLSTARYWAYEQGNAPVSARAEGKLADVFDCTVEAIREASQVSQDQQAERP